MDPFAGKRRDPQSLHKYVYAHEDPIQRVDPSGLLAGGVNGTIVTTSIMMSLAATYLVLKPVVDQAFKTSSPLTRLAHALKAEVIDKNRLRTKKAVDENNYKYFVHGSNWRNVNWWSPLGFARISPSFGRPDEDFGLGFYTFRADITGVDRATQRAKQAGKLGAFLLVFKMETSRWTELDVVEWTNPSDPGYIQVVNGFRHGSPGYESGLYNADVVGGWEANQWPPGSGNWVANPNGGFQYKFETPRSVDPTRLIPAYLVPVGPTVHMA